MKTQNIMYKGSVKNILSDEKKSLLLFEYTDQYSIFDWGKMPDLIPGKGKALASIADIIFKFFESKKNWNEWERAGRYHEDQVFKALGKSGLPHHSLGTKSTNEAQSRLLSVKKVEVIRPNLVEKNGSIQYDYGIYSNTSSLPSSFLVPLEVIFRFGVPKGSSLLKRVNDKNYLNEIGLDTPPKEGSIFEKPVIEFSTKLESYDRYMSYSEAKGVSGMTEEEFDKLKTLSSILALRLKDLFSSIGVELWDGKFEFALTSHRSLMLVDSIGPDELRLLKEGIQLSKEFFRQYYTDTPWCKAVQKSKSLAKERGVLDWKAICEKELELVPSPLSESALEMGTHIYTSLANALSMKLEDRKIFEDSPDLDELIQKIKAVS